MVRDYGAWAVAAPLMLRGGDRSRLEALTRSSLVRAGLAGRARIVLLAADGLPNAEIARRTGTSRPTVVGWPARYAEVGIQALEDLPRSGRPAEHGQPSESTPASDPAVAAHRDPFAVGEHALGAQPRELLGALVRRGGAVGVQHPVPRQVVSVLGEDPADQPRPARQPGARGDVAVGEHRARWDRGDHRPDAFQGLLVHHATGRSATSACCMTVDCPPKDGCNAVAVGAT